MAETTPTPGEVYQREMVPAIFARWAPDLVELGGVRPGQRVLDVACGTGVVTRLAADRVGPGGRVIGLDLNPVMLAAARAAGTASNVEWREASADKSGLPDRSVDVVLCQQGLQFFPDKPAALREMRRVLVPGGRLALAVWRSSEHVPAFRALEDALAGRIGRDKAALPPFSFGDGEAVRAVVAGAGFRDVTLRAEVKMSRFRSAEHMVRTVVAGAPTMLGVLAQQGPDALDAIVAEVTERTRALLDDDGLAASTVSWLVTATA